MRPLSLVATLAAGLTVALHASEAIAQSGRHAPAFASGTLIGANGLPWNPSAGSSPYLPFGGMVSQLPSGRTIFVPQSSVTWVYVPGAAPPWPTTNLASAPPQVIRIGPSSEAGRRGARVVVVNGSSPSLRPESGPKIIRIER